MLRPFDAMNFRDTENYFAKLFALNGWGGKNSEEPAPTDEPPVY
jgi:hypothetical protein